MINEKIEKAITESEVQARFGSHRLTEASMLFMVDTVNKGWHKPAMMKLLEAELHLKSALAEIEQIKESNSVDVNKEYEG